MSEITKFFWNVHKAFVLPWSNERILPGALLETEWRPTWPFPWAIDTNPEFRRFEGYAWDKRMLDLSKEDYPSTLVEGGILTGVITDRFEFGGEISLPQVGLDLGVDFNNKIRAELEVEQVRVRLFDHGFSHYDLQGKLHDLRNTDRAKYRWVDDDYLVSASYYLQGLRWRFTREGAAEVKAEFERQGFDLTAKADVGWEDNETLRFTGVSKVPIAVQGMKI